MASKGWARCLDSVADVLRRGAWYPIVEETAEHVVLDVHEKRVRLSRADAGAGVTIKRFRSASPRPITGASSSAPA